MPGWSSQALFLGAIAAALIAVFAIGGMVLAFGARTDKLEPKVDIDQPEVEAHPRSDDIGDLTLVPDNGPLTTVGRSITTTPAPNVDAQLGTSYDRRDATALPSQEYARILQNTQQQPAAPQAFQPVDPRNIAGNVHQPQPGSPRPPAPPRQRTAPAGEETREARDESGAGRTRPVPVSQPLPKFDHLKEGGTMSFNLTVGPDGRVRGVDVIKTVPNMTARMISALHKWRFKPATSNGQPVEGTFHVEISFNADE